jgi:hypothetical protein
VLALSRARPQPFEVISGVDNFNRDVDAAPFHFFIHFYSFCSYRLCQPFAVSCAPHLGQVLMSSTQSKRAGKPQKGQPVFDSLILAVGFGSLSILPGPRTVESN